MKQYIALSFDTNDIKKIKSEKKYNEVSIIFKFVLKKQHTISNKIFQTFFENYANENIVTNFNLFINRKTGELMYSFRAKVNQKEFNLISVKETEDAKYYSYKYALRQYKSQLL